MLFGTTGTVCPEAEAKIKNTIFSDFSTLIKCPSEAGSCKKMIPLHYQYPEFAGLAVVFTHNANEKDADIVRNERKYLAYLLENHYPVVAVHGPEFVVSSLVEGHNRLGMLMNYIDGIFIEAKTPSVLKLMILSCLLKLPVKSQESWVAFNLNAVIQAVLEKLANPDDFQLLRSAASTLGNNFGSLIHLFSSRAEMIVDLQMMITSAGDIVIIDPLDIVDCKTQQSVVTTDVKVEPNPHLAMSLQNANLWLKQAQSFCRRIAQAKCPADIIPFVNMQADPLIFSTKADREGKSRINKLKMGSYNAPAPGSTSNNLVVNPITFKL
jgi:hypothetical protein